MAADLAITTELVGLTAVLAGFSRIENAAKQIGDGFTAAGAQLQAVGRSLAVNVTAPLTAFGAAGVKVASDFEAGMNKVAAISDATGDQLKKMTDLAVTLGAQTKFSAGEAAEGMANLAAAGFSVEQTMKALGPSMRLAEAAGISLGDATRITGATLNQFKLDAGELTRIGDLMVATSNRSAAGMLDLGEAFIKVGPLAKATDQSIEDMLAVIAKLADAGVQGEVAGTALAAAIGRLIDPPKAAREAIEDLGLKIKDSNGNMRSFVDILGDVERAGASAEQIIALFGIEAGRYLISIKGSADETKKFSADLATAGGEMDRVGKIMNQGLSYQVQQLMGALESLAIRIGQTGLLGDLTRVTAGVADFVDDLSRSSPEVLRFGTAVAAGAAALGPLGIALGLSVQGLRPFALLIGGLVSPVGLAAVAVAGLVTAFDGWDDIGRIVGETTEAVTAFGRSVLSAFSSGGIEAALDRVAQAFAGLGRQVTDALSGLGSELVDAIAAQAASIEPRLGPIGEDLGRWLAASIVSAVQALARGASELGAAILDWISAEVTSGRVEGGVRDALAVLARVFEDLGKFAVGFLSGFGDEIYRQIADTLAGQQERIAAAVDDYVVAPFRGLADKIEEAWADVQAKVRQIIDDYIVGPFRDLEAKIRAVLPTSLSDSIFGPRVAAEIRANAEAAASEIPPPMQAAADEVRRIGEGLGENLVGPRVADEVRSQMEGVASTVTSTVEQMNVDVSRLTDETVDIYGTQFDEVQNKALAFQDEMVGNSIIPDTVDAILGEWRRLDGLQQITTDSLGPVIGEFDRFSVSLDQTFPEDFAANIDQATFAFGQQRGELGQLNLTLDGTRTAMQGVTVAQEETAARSRTAVEGMRAGWDAYYRDVTDWGRTWEDATRNGLKTLEGSISEFIQTGRFNFDDLKNFAIKSFADMTAQGIMAFVVQGGQGLGLFGSQSKATLTDVTTTGTSLFQGFSTSVQGIFATLQGVVTGWAGAITSLVQGLLATLSAAWSAFGATLTALFGSLAQTVSGWSSTVSSTFGQLWEFLANGWNTFAGLLGSIFDGLADVVANWSDLAISLFSSFWDAASKIFNELLSLGGSVFSGIGGSWGGLIGDFIGGVASLGGAAVDAIGGVGSAVGGITDLVAGFFAEGGIVEGKGKGFKGRGTDTVLAWLTPGEFVVNREAAEKYTEVLEQINGGSFPTSGSGALPSGYGGKAAAGLFGEVLGGMVGNIAGPMIGGEWGAAVAGLGPRAGSALAGAGYREWEDGVLGTQRVLDEMTMMNLDELSRKGAQAGLVDEAALTRQQFEDLQGKVQRTDAAASFTGYAMKGLGFLAGSLLGPPGALAVRFATPFAIEFAAQIARNWEAVVKSIRDFFGLADREIAIRSGLGGLDSDGNFTPGPGGFPNEFPDFGGNPGIGGGFDPGGFGGGGGGGSFDPGFDPGISFDSNPGFANGGWVRGFATGGDAVFTSPTMIQVAEQGAERVSVRPLGRDTDRQRPIVFRGPVIANDLSMTQLARRMMREIERETRRVSGR